MSYSTWNACMDINERSIGRLDRPGCSGGVRGVRFTDALSVRVLTGGDQLTLSLGLSHTMATGFLSSPINDFDDTRSVASSQNGSFIDFSQSAARFLFNTRSARARSGTVSSEDSATPIYAQHRSDIRINTNMTVRIYTSNSHFQPLFIAPLIFSPHAGDLCLQHPPLTGPAPHT